jgi:hypothetical protein
LVIPQPEWGIRIKKSSTTGNFIKKVEFLLAPFLGKLAERGNVISKLVFLFFK